MSAPSEAGAVDYEYRISQYEITIAEFQEAGIGNNEYYSQPSHRNLQKMPQK